MTEPSRIRDRMFLQVSGVIFVDSMGKSGMEAGSSFCGFIYKVRMVAGLHLRGDGASALASYRPKAVKLPQEIH
ncbi:MAG: hypothetical protein A4E52_00613 [Pelotomaculum sp. PtaB.Bin013]|nr:MAG: hypothetical protein A4E52_00613 [Pelotomaculum sp. PtaB.Bin013]